MTADVWFLVFALEFVLAHLVDAIAAIIFLHHRGVPLYITYPAMLVTTYMAMYMVYSGIWELIGRLTRRGGRVIGFTARNFRPDKGQGVRFLPLPGRGLMRTPPLNILLWTGEKYGEEAVGLPKDILSWCLLFFY